MHPIYEQPPAPRRVRRGFTLELNRGVGGVRLTDHMSDSTSSDVGLAGLSVGVGGWVSEKVAISGRLAGVTISEDDSQFSAIFVGPSAQYWVDEHFWLGGGLGFGIAATDNSGTSDGLVGLGLDIRVGYTFSQNTQHTFNASLEINPSFLSEDGVSATATGIGMLFGYQYL